MREGRSAAFLLLLGPPQQTVRQGASPFQLLQMGGTCRPRAVHLCPVEVAALTMVAGIGSQFV